ncbi:MAG: DUF4097 family beta strand repeat protein [Ignavibacterium sp.]|nr:MAG: DUF4097 family beta strand repeat protein [Ignavibacterium sp.]
MKNYLFLVVITLFSAHIILGCGSNYHYSDDDLQVIHEKTFPIKPGNDLRVKTSGGDVTVTSWDKSEVYIKVLGNDKARDDIDYKFYNTDSYVELITESKSSFGNWFGGISLRIEVKVPEKFNAKIHTSGGDLKLGGVDGDHQLSTSGGDITCKKFSGNLDLSTSGGDITMMDGLAKISASTSGGDIKLDYAGENLGIDLSTSGGDILVKLPSNFDASMELSTSGGDVSCNLNMNNTSKLSEHKIVADLNNGGKEFYAHTSGGDIDVMKK